MARGSNVISFPKPGSVIRFSLSSNLGRLARHLRLLGFDTTWSTDRPLTEALEEARQEGRALLVTASERDELTATCAGSVEGVRIHGVEQTGNAEQLTEVLHRFELVEPVRSGKGYLSRCLDCNHELLPVQPHQVHHLVSGTILLQYDQFHFCSRCERVYWSGKDSRYDQLQAWARKLVASE